MGLGAKPYEEISKFSIEKIKICIEISQNVYFSSFFWLLLDRFWPVRPAGRWPAGGRPVSISTQNTNSNSFNSFPNELKEAYKMQWPMLIKLARNSCLVCLINSEMPDSNVFGISNSNSILKIK